MTYAKTVMYKLKKPYFIGVLLIVILLSLSFLMFENLIIKQQENNSLIKLTGKQQMLLQQQAFDLINLQRNWHTSEKKTLQARIKQTAQDITTNHQSLLNATDSLSITILPYYFKGTPSVDEKINVLTTLSLNIAEQANEVDANKLINKYFDRLSVADLSVEFNQIVDVMEATSKKDLLNMEYRALLMCAVSLMILLALIVRLFNKLTVMLTKSYHQFQKEKEKVDNFKFAINKHSVVFWLELDHTISYVNEKFCELYGYRADEIIGQHKKILRSDEHEQAIFDDMYSTIGKGEEWQKVLCNTGKNQRQYWLETTVVPIMKKNSISSYMVIQNDISEQKRMSFALSKMHTIIADHQQSLADKITELLILGKDLFHLPLAIVSEIKGNNYKVVYASSPNNEILPGTQFDLSGTYCFHTLNADKPIAFSHVGTSEIRHHPCYQNFQLESYIGCPITVDKQRFGTLNFSSAEIHEAVFTTVELELIQLMAQWIGYEMMKERDHQKMISQQKLMTEMSKQARIGAWEVDLINESIIWSDMTKEIHEVTSDYEPDLTTAIAFYKEGESRDKISHLVAQAISSGKDFQTELELVTAKGNVIWVSSHGHAIFENGRCVTLYGSFQDINEQKMAEFEIQAQNRRLGLAADSAGMGVWELNLITNELNWDDWMFRLYGTKPELSPDPHSVLQQSLHPDDIEPIKAAFHLAVQGKQKFDTQFRVIHPSGSLRYIKAAALVLRDNDNVAQMMVGVNYDVTEQVESELALTTAKTIAEQASKVKNEFLASMSHEIRTPMNGVVGMLNLLSDTQLTAEQEHQVTVAKSSANSLLFLINDILDFSKIDANKLELEEISFDINLLVSEFVDSISQQTQQKNIELIIDTVGITEAMIVGDPNRIRQILTNLVSNAIKFTEVGEVLVKLALVPFNKNYHRLKIAIIDTGIGIPQDKQAHLFDSFSQVDASTTRQFGGTGLGLAIVKKLCQCMAGNISVMSEVGKGSTFTCDIQIGKAQQILAKLPSKVLDNISVLVVDDNKTNCEVLVKQLANWKVKAQSVNSAREALALCQQQLAKGPEHVFDIAILDMQMPSMDGAELGYLLRQEQRFDSMKLIMMTSMNLPGDGKRFAKLGFNAYFSKPATSSDVFNALNILYDNGKALTDAKPLVTRHYIKTLTEHGKKPVPHNELPIWPQDTLILLVEDNRVNQMVAQGVLGHLGLKCEIANNGQEAIDMLNNEPQQYTLILMDCQMPVLDGYDATGKIRQGQAGKRYIDVPIIAMTANAMKGDREKCIDAGMNDYLSKPIDKDLIIEKLRDWLIKE